MIHSIPGSKWSMKWEKNSSFLDISIHCVVQLLMCSISLHHSCGSGRLIGLISEPSAAMFQSPEMWKLRTHFFVLDNCIMLLSTRGMCKVHPVTDRRTNARTDGRTDDIFCAALAIRNISPCFLLL